MPKNFVFRRKALEGISKSYEDSLVAFCFIRKSGFLLFYSNNDFIHINAGTFPANTQKLSALNIINITRHLLSLYLGRSQSIFVIIQ